MKKVTLKELGNILGLSTSTISKALKDYSDINPDTKRKVQELAESLNYTPNAFAQSLRSHETKIIGLLVPDLVHHFFSSIINSVINAAEKYGYLVIVLHSNESYEDEIKQLKLLADKNIDGILLSLSDKTIEYNHVNDIIKKGMPVVLFDKISRLIDCSMVIINDRKAAFDATEHLIKTGCKTIAHITGPLKPKTTIDRYIGYKSALEKYNIPFDKSLIYTSENLSIDDGYDLAYKMIGEHPDIDGVFGFIDPVAIGALKAFKDQKIKVPKQVSVIGFSNWLMTETTTPSLTTVDQHACEMGRKALELLLNNIKQIKEGKDVVHKTIEIPTSIVYRNSTKVMRTSRPLSY